MSTNRAAIVTGGAQGIGRATAHRLAAQSVAICLVDREEAQLEATAAELEAKGAHVERVIADVTLKSDVENMASTCLAAFGRIDVLANIAGGAGGRHLHQIDEIEDDDWELVVNLNLKSTFMGCRAVVPAMRDQQYGRIVNVSASIAHGWTGPVDTAGARLVYAAAKSGILGLTAQLAKDVGVFDITVNAVLPWLTFGDQGARIRSKFEALDTEMRDRILSDAPLGRAAEADEVAAAIALLASEDASYISGQGLPVDGAYR